jgi:hypothetical protein
MTPESWHETNQRLLVAEVARVRALLEAHVGGDPGVAPAVAPAPALTSVCQAFDLSPFERDVLVMCAAVELDGGFAAAAGRPTFALALAALPDAHWSAITPTAPLRGWRLVEVPAGEPITAAPLRIDEAVLHFLAGAPSLDQRLHGVVEAIVPGGPLPASQQAVATLLAERWSAAGPQPPLVHLEGPDPAGRRAVAAAAAGACGMAVSALRGADVPALPDEREDLARLWERHALLGGGALLVDCDDLDSPEQARAARAFAQRVRSPVALGAREASPAPVPLMRLTIDRPRPAEQEGLWRQVLGDARPNGALTRVLAQFDLATDEIHAAGADAQARAAGGTDAADALWEACRAQARPRLDDLAQRIEPTAGWDDLVVPDRERRTLTELVLHVRHRALVYDQWGFAAKSGRGLGVSALFAGPSGTGKTMAAEVLARELRLDLYRIDLSAVVSKWIGETEKNLRRVFDAAEQGGAILLFDEADALFGKRSEVKDSHDRYANIEVGYLLQRMEAYRGLAILTTNLKSALDPAFMRRIRFVVHFARPDAAARRAIWHRIFLEQTPVDALDVDALGRLDATGGTIRNIALRAAFLAADAGTPVSMAHLAQAARGECAKLERPATEVEIGSWT